MIAKPGGITTDLREWPRIKTSQNLTTDEHKGDRTITRNLVIGNDPKSTHGASGHTEKSRSRKATENCAKRNPYRLETTDRDLSLCSRLEHGRIDHGSSSGQPDLLRKIRYHRRHPCPVGEPRLLQTGWKDHWRVWHRPGKTAWLRGRFPAWCADQTSE